MHGFVMQISATLIISGEFLNPDEISKILNVVPHSSKRKGDVRTFKSKKTIIAKFGLWEWRSKHSSCVVTLNEHICTIAKTFAHVHNDFLNLPGVENAWIDVHFVLGGEPDKISSASFLIDTETISALYKMKVPVEITVDSI